MTQEIPQVIIPKTNEFVIYKVIQVDLDRKPYIRFGDVYTIHSKILEAFLKEHNIQSEPFERHGDKITHPKGDRYKLVGAGRASIGMPERIIHFSGDSIHYGLGVNHEHLSKLEEHFEAKGFKIEFE